MTIGRAAPALEQFLLGMWGLAFTILIALLIYAWWTMPKDHR